MSFSPKRSVEEANAALNGQTALLNSGFIKIYTVGSGVPATVATAITDQLLLVTLTFGSTAFAAASGGVASANPIGSGVAINTGNHAFFRFTDSSGNARFQGLTGTAGSDLNLSAATIGIGDTVAITAFSITEPLQ